MRWLKICLLIGLVSGCWSQERIHGRRRLTLRGQQNRFLGRPSRFFAEPTPPEPPTPTGKSPRPTPIDPTTILHSKPSPSPTPSFSFQPKPSPTFSAKGPRPVPINLDKVFQIPKFEPEPEQPKPAPPPPRPEVTSRFDNALRQVLSRPPPSPPSSRFEQRPPVQISQVDDFNIEPRPQGRPQPQFRFRASPPKQEEPNDFKPFVPAPQPAPEPSPPVQRVSRPRGRQLAVDPVDTEPIQYPVNYNQHLTLIKEEKLVQKPIDFIDAKIRKDPVKVTSNYMNRNDDGTFTFGYTSEDGSFKEETRGKDCIVRGKYGYVDPTGVKREFTYETGNPCDPETKLPLDADPLANQGYYDYNKGVYVTPTGREIRLQVQRARRIRRMHY